MSISSLPPGGSAWFRSQLKASRQSINRRLPAARRPDLKSNSALGTARGGLHAAGDGRRVHKETVHPHDLIENPATPATGAQLNFTLLWEGKPLADTQVALFRKGEDGDAGTRTLTRTDASGRAGFTIPASGIYMAAGVHMIEAPADRNADWQSYWASLTFAVEKAGSLSGSRAKKGLP